MKDDKYYCSYSINYDRELDRCEFNSLIYKINETNTYIIATDREFIKGTMHEIQIKVGEKLTKIIKKYKYIILINDSI